MNKKLIIGIILVLLIITIGFALNDEVSKAESEIPEINSHLQNANYEYNQSVNYLNNKNYSLSTQHINKSYTEYTLAKEKTETALNKSKRNNQSLQVEYFNYTLTELDYKINACIEMYNGLNHINSNPSLALTYFSMSNKYMQNATDCSYNRTLLEEQYPDKFIR